MRIATKLAAALALGSFAIPVHAQSSNGITLDELLQALGEHAKDVNRNTSNDDEVYFTANVTGTDGDSYGIVAVPRDCTGAVPRCPVVTIYANFEWGEIDKPTLEKLINFNDTNLRGRSYGFGDTVGVDYQIYLGEGAGKAYLSARVGEFPGIIASFVSHMKE